MNKSKILVTGASGFIGMNLVHQLVSAGHEVTCFVRPTSNVDELRPMRCRVVFGDVTDRASLAEYVKGQNAIFHLAAKTKALNKQEMMHVNVEGVFNLMIACRECESPPVVVLMSSLAAVGPSSEIRPHIESDECRPVSNYGVSKEQAEAVARKFCGDVPVSIVRPPIVLGERDREGLALFKSIDFLGMHMVPGGQKKRFSIIHVGDLIRAMMAVASEGCRLNGDQSESGIYFAAADEIPTYRELGIMIGRALGKKKVRVLKCPPGCIWALGAINTVLGKMIQKPQFLDWDKAREATAGSWSCSNDKLKKETGFSPAYPLVERVKQTIGWYREKEWLPPQTSYGPQSQTPSDSVLQNRFENVH